MSPVTGGGGDQQNQDQDDSNQDQQNQDDQQDSDEQKNENPSSNQQQEQKSTLDQLLREMDQNPRNLEAEEAVRARKARGKLAKPLKDW